MVSPYPPPIPVLGVAIEQEAETNGLKERDR